MIADRRFLVKGFSVAKAMDQKRAAPSGSPMAGSPVYFFVKISVAPDSSICSSLSTRVPTISSPSEVMVTLSPSIL